MAKVTKVTREPINPHTGELVRGRKAGRPASSLAKRHRRVALASSGDIAVIYDERHWDFVEDPYNFHRPTDAQGIKVSSAHPVEMGWLVPAS